MEILYENGEGVEVVTLTSLVEIEEMVSLFEAIGCAEGWQPNGQLQAWMQGTVYFAVRVDDKLAGGIQLVPVSAGGTLPCHAVWPELANVSKRDAAHVVMMALAREYRGRAALFWMPAVEIWRYCFRKHISELWLECTPSMLKFYERVGWTLEVRGPLRMHWGELCYPCSFSLEAITRSILMRAVKSEAYRKLVAQACRGEDNRRPGSEYQEFPNPLVAVRG
jgi:hypothetical protein